MSLTVFGQTSDTALDLFKKGNFDEADKIIKNPKSYDDLLLKGQISLFSNKLKEAKKYLEKAAKLKPDEKLPKQFLGEVFYRMNDFQKASEMFAASGRETVAKKLASFEEKKPYEIESKAEITNIKFVKTDPLPIVSAKINGGEELNFIIDTGGGELIVDSDIAAKYNLTQFGEETGTFGGGRRSAYLHGKIESFTLGEFTIKNVPINIIKTQRFAATLGIKNVDGIIGSILLSRFISTIDYPNAQLILRKNTKENLGKLEKSIEIPFWMAGDHFLLAWGTVNKSPQLLFIDSGLAGMGFTAPESTLKEAKINLGNQSLEGVGGGGTVKVIPFVTDEITLGTVKREKIIGIAGAFPPPLENGFGFRIGGLISHSFFRNHRVTFDFLNMRILMTEKTN